MASTQKRMHADLPYQVQRIEKKKKNGTLITGKPPGEKKEGRNPP